MRHGPRSVPLTAQLSYLQRDGVTRDGTPGRMFDAAGDEVDARDFAGRCQGDRHHFRFIVSPDDAGELSDLRAFTRDLMGEMARDLGTRLDCAAIDHWNTEHPHIHVLVRGQGDDGGDLVISRDYICRGLRARAERLATLELGPHSEQEVRQALERQVDADRWTSLDQALWSSGSSKASASLRRAGCRAGDRPMLAIRPGFPVGQAPVKLPRGCLPVSHRSKTAPPSPVLSSCADKVTTALRDHISNEHAGGSAGR